MSVYFNTNAFLCKNIYKSSFLKCFVRMYRGGNRNIRNVGIKNRLKLFSEENHDVDQLNIDEKALDELETELTSGKHIVDLHRRNIENLKNKIELKTIERKYFEKIKIPNFLTWSEKEQIKELHARDPDFWTCDKLSESFPATPDIIKKIIKSSWKPSDANRLLRHDQNVCKNWEKLKKGEIHLDPALHQHLLTFSSRQNLQHSDSSYIVKQKKPMFSAGSDFTKIILNYTLQKSKETDKVDLLESGHQTESNRLGEHSKSRGPSINPIPRYTRSNRMTTLEELRKNLATQKSPSQFTKFDEAFLKEEKTQADFLTDLDDYEMAPNKNELDENVSSSQPLTPTENEQLRMTIKIPQNRPKASVYKVKNVYYDSKGNFLFRVPGMK